MNKAVENKQVSPKDDATLPAGFARVDTDLDSYPAWDFDVRDTLQGKVEKVKTVEVTRNKELVECRMAVVNVNGDRCLLWESANLERLFDDLRPGAEVFVKYHGKEDIGKGKTMRRFTAGVK